MTTTPVIDYVSNKILFLREYNTLSARVQEQKKTFSVFMSAAPARTAASSGRGTNRFCGAAGWTFCHCCKTVQRLFKITWAALGTLCFRIKTAQQQFKTGTAFFAGITENRHKNHSLFIWFDRNISRNREFFKAILIFHCKKLDLSEKMCYIISMHIIFQVRA